MYQINNDKYYKRVFAKKVVYKGIEFNSKLEADFANFLDGKEVKHKGHIYLRGTPIRWQYEPKSFVLLPQEKWVDRTEIDTSLKKAKRNKEHTLPQIVYTPDFYLPDYDLWIETKGKAYDDKLFHLRFRLFKHCYPSKAIWVVRHHDDFMKIDEILYNISIDSKKIQQSIKEINENDNSKETNSTKTKNNKG